MATPIPLSKVVFDPTGKQVRPDFTVVSAEIEDHDRMIDKATIVIDDPDGQASKIAVPGMAVTVELGWTDESAILFHGLVETPTTCQTGGRGQTSILVYDDGILMHRDKKQVSHTGTLSSIVNKIVGAYKAFDLQVKADPDPEFTDKQPLVQANLTDYEFLNQAALYYGARSFVEWDSKKKKPVYWFVNTKALYAAKPIGSLEYCCGYSKLLEFTYQRVAGRAGTQMVASVMDTATGTVQPVVGETPAAAPVPGPGKDDPSSGATADALAAAATQAQTNASTPPAPSPQPPQPSDKKRSESLAIRDPTRILGWTGKGRAVGTVKMAAKSRVTIKGVAPWAEGDWYIGLATHRYHRLVKDKRDASTYETSFVVTR